MSFEQLPQVVGMRKVEIERRANTFLRETCPAVLTVPCPTPIEDLLQFEIEEKYGIIFSTDNLSAPAEGVTIPGEIPEIRLSEGVFDELLEHNGRARFTGSHEIGHGILHVHQLKEVLVSTRQQNLLFRKTSSIPVWANPEWQANKFATYILMPSATMVAAINQYGPNVPRLAEIYQVSLQAMTFRLGDFRAA